MSPEQISAFQAASLMKPDAVSLVMLGLFSAFLLLWVVWMLKSAENPWGLALNCFSSPPQKLEAAKP
ncbi:DUF3262 family protein [Klebsiella oxytoca]|uniref:DUF3262 family protein n=1 Tax=Klebsiella oxytoca TaxID=571 RepID=UPI001CC91086|nr:DUF3262 family protein [Klebsiella oxytoca]MBZ7685890.1 DUF3262 family protein [Klebsiella oxytoca]